jgi:hypothetical protein
LIWQIFSPEARRRRGSAKPAAPSLEREQLYIVFAGPRENSDIIVIYSEIGNIKLENKPKSVSSRALGRRGIQKLRKARNFT